jgi:hypothetical protein
MGGASKTSGKIDSPVLRITGPEGHPYRLGDPMHLYDGETYLGDVESVRVGAGGHEVELENFHHFNTPLQHRVQVGRLVLAEVLEFIFGTFTTVQAVRVTLSSDIESFPGEGIELARMRAELLQSAGCECVTTAPKPHARYAGHFEVSAIWTYSTSSVETLKSALRDERAAYCQRQQEARAVQEEGSWLRRIFRRLDWPPGSRRRRPSRAESVEEPRDL